MYDVSASVYKHVFWDMDSFLNKFELDFTVNLHYND